MRRRPAGQVQALHQKAYGGLQQGGKAEGQQEGEQPGEEKAQGQPQSGQGQGGIEQAEQKAQVSVFRQKTASSPENR